MNRTDGASIMKSIITMNYHQSCGVAFFFFFLCFELFVFFVVAFKITISGKKKGLHILKQAEQSVKRCKLVKRRKLMNTRMVPESSSRIQYVMYIYSVAVSSYGAMAEVF